MKNLTAEDLTNIIQNQSSDLPVPRIETRNFYALSDENPYEMKAYTYMLLVFEPLVGKVDVSILNSSVATYGIKSHQPFYMGWRREGDILNLMTQLNLRSFIVDSDHGNYKEVILTEGNCPNGLKTKSYYKKP